MSKRSVSTPTNIGKNGRKSPFGHLLILKENRFAFTALDRLCSRRTNRKGLLVYIYGPAGVGKSHLIHYFRREISVKEPDLVVRHCTASELAGNFATASAEETIPDFQTELRSTRFLFCEDIQALRRRKETQQQLLTAMDELYSHAARIVITGNVAPGELADFSPKLINRFHGGTCALVAIPSLESRTRLIDQFASAMQVAIPPDSSELLARSLQVSPRELKSAVTQLDAMARVNKARIDQTFVKRFLKRDVQATELSLTKIATSVARHFGVKVKDLRAESRRQGLVIPRQTAMYLARELTGLSCNEIATYFHRRNHSTIIHACKRIESQLEKDVSLRQQLNQIRRMFSG